MLLAKGNWITLAELPRSITSDQSPSLALNPEDTLSIKKSSKSLERNLIRKALELTGGNRTQAAKILEISRPMLISKIKEYKLK
jgi:two-component system response regulator AtoC